MLSHITIGVVEAVSEQAVHIYLTNGDKLNEQDVSVAFLNLCQTGILFVCLGKELTPLEHPTKTHVYE